MVILVDFWVVVVVGLFDRDLDEFGLMFWLVILEWVVEFLFVMWLWVGKIIVGYIVVYLIKKFNLILKYYVFYILYLLY